MRAVAALLTIPGADKHPQLNEFVTQVLQSTFALPIKAFTATYDVFRSRAPLTWRACSRASRRTPETLPPMGWTSAEGVAAVVQGAVCFFYFHIYVQSYDNDIFVLLFFRWGQWECVWDGGCEKKAGWFGTFDGGGPHPSPWTSAPFKKVMAQDFVILLLKTSRGCHDSLIIMQFHLLWIFMQFHTGLWSQKVHQWPSDDRNDTSYPAKNVTLTVM